jgi:hypothetical protein
LELDNLDFERVARDLVNKLEQESFEAEEVGWEIDFSEGQILEMALLELQEDEGYTDEQIKKIEKICLLRQVYKFSLIKICF